MTSSVVAGVQPKKRMSYGTVFGSADVESPDEGVPRRRRRHLVVLGSVLFVFGLFFVSAVSIDSGKPREEEFYAQDPEGEVCMAFDQSADYSKCGRLEPDWFYWLARARYGDQVEESCRQSASFVPENPVPWSHGMTMDHWANWNVGNAWFLVCTYQALAHLDEYCNGTFVAEAPTQEALPNQAFGHDGLLPTIEDITKGWTDPCAAHAFCSACDQGNNAYCKAFMQQRALCSRNPTDYSVHTIFHTDAREYWCSKVPDIQAGTFEPSLMSFDECNSLFFP